MIKIVYYFIFLLLLLSTQNSFAFSNNCEKQILEAEKTYVPNEFQAYVILNSFMKERIVNDMRHWFTESHFPYGNSTVWHQIDLTTTTIDLIEYGINEKLIIVYYDSQNYCGVGGQCSSYLLRETNNEWIAIDQWHEVKWEYIYLSNCESETLFIQLNEGNEFGEYGLDHGRIIKVDLKTK